MPDNSVQIRVAADLANINAAFQRLGQTLNTSFSAGAQGSQRLAASIPPLQFSVRQMTEETDKSLLSNRESARLLSEEMGIHLPRAVTGAIAEMMPAIGGLGGAFLGVFAIEKAYDWGKTALGVIKDLQSGTTEALDDIGKEAEATAKRVHDELGKMFTDFKSSAGAQLPMEEVELRAHQLTKYYQAFIDLQKAQNEMKRPTEETLKVIGQAVGEGLTNIEDVGKKLSEVSALQLEQHRHLAGVVQKESHDSCEHIIKDNEAAARAARELSRSERQFREGEYKMVMRDIHAMQEAGKATEQLRKSEEAEAETKERMARADLVFMVNLERIGIAERNQAQDFERLVPRVMDLANATKHLSAMQSEYQFVKQDAIRVEESFTQAIKAEVVAVQEDMLGSIANLTEGLAGLIGGQKAAAYFKAGYEIAEGIACLASGTWPPNPAAIIASGLHFEAAAEYAMLGGGGGGRRGGGGGGGTQSSYGRGGGGGGASTPSGGAGGAATPGSGTTIHMHIAGVISSDNLTQVMAQMSSLTRSGQATLDASNALYNGQKLG